MKWRDVLIGSIATLIVTILSGVVIYYITREPHVEAKEDLVFLVDNSASFQFTNNDIAVASVILVNRGTKPANNIVGEIAFPVGHIKDKKITSTSGADSEIKAVADSTNKYSFTMARFLPNDKVTMSFLLDVAVADPHINIRSDGSIANKGTYTQPPTEPAKKNALKTLGTVVTPLILGLMLALFSAIVAKLIVGKRPRAACLNNTAFVLMHKGMIERADRMLRRAVYDGKEGAHALANYGLSRGLLGKEDECSQLLAAAAFLANTKHESAVIQFNHSLLSMKGAKWDEAREQLAEALRLSRAEITFYCKNSSIFSHLAKDQPDIMAMLNPQK